MRGLVKILWDGPACVMVLLVDARLNVVTKLQKYTSFAYSSSISK